jgi:integrase
LLTAPGAETIKEKRDRAILSTLLFDAPRREELCKLKVKDFTNMLRGVPDMTVSGKGEKTRYLPLYPGTNALIHEYIEAAGHDEDEQGALFRPIPNNRTGKIDRALDPDMIYKLALKSVRIRSPSQPPPTPSITGPTSPRCRSGSATPRSRQRASMITATRGPRTVQLSK